MSSVLAEFVGDAVCEYSRALDRRRQNRIDRDAAVSGFLRKHFHQKLPPPILLPAVHADPSNGYALDSYMILQSKSAQRARKVNASISAVDSFAMVLSLTDSWLSAPSALQAASGDPLSAKRLAQHRKALVEAVRLITETTLKT